MKVRSLKIADFKGIESLELDFTNPHTEETLDTVVLAGPNGCGKTSVLEAVLLTTAREKDVFGNHQNIKAKNLVRNGRSSFSIIASFSFDNAMERELLNTELISILPGYRAYASRVAGRLPHLDIPFYDPPNQELNAFSFIPEITLDNFLNIYYFMENLLLRDPALPAGLLKRIESINQKLETCLRIEYFETWRHPTLPGPMQLSANSTSGNRVEANRFKALKQFLINDDARTKYGKRSLFPWDRFEKVWNSLMGGRLNMPKIGLPEDDKQGPFDIFVSDRNGGRFSIDMLSSGEIELFTFFGWLLRKDYSNAIILIEEPELHLHPQWHRAIMNALRDALPSAQIIVTTHSPEIVNSVYSYERFYLIPQDQLLEAGKPLRNRDGDDSNP